VKRVNKTFAHVVRATNVVTLENSEAVTPHTLRHTAAIWAMQGGADLWEAAGYLGMTIQMLAERYGHHHPQHMQTVRNALTWRHPCGGEKDRLC
jgi:integrase